MNNKLYNGTKDIHHGIHQIKFNKWLNYMKNKYNNIMKMNNYNQNNKKHYLIFKDYIYLYSE